MGANESIGSPELWSNEIMYTVYLFIKEVNDANCIIKNLSETHSLPHVRNLSEMSRSERLNGRQSEVNDERQESGNQGVVKPVPKGQQEGEGAGSGRAGCADGIQPLVWGRAVAMGWQGHPRRATGASGGGFAQEGQTHQTAAVR